MESRAYYLENTYEIPSLPATPPETARETLEELDKSADVDYRSKYSLDTIRKVRQLRKIRKALRSKSAFV